jgi:hypothetical protein
MKNPVTVILSTLGTIFMLAMAFKVLPTNIALFAGVSCYVLAGASKKIFRPF